MKSIYSTTCVLAAAIMNNSKATYAYSSFLRLNHPVPQLFLQAPRHEQSSFTSPFQHFPLPTSISPKAQYHAFTAITTELAGAGAYIDGDRSKIDFQSDSSNFGRGDMHLSAFLDEGDVVVYQTGTWTVDGVEVGDGTPPKLKYAKIDCIQLVWTHNCEHGVIRGMGLELDERHDEGKGQRVVVSSSSPESLDSLEWVEFGPEQLLARLPVDWGTIGEDEGVLLCNIPPSLL